MEIRLRQNTQDRLALREVVLRNCYRLPDRMDGMRVLDVGAHIGTFARSCLDRGAATVWAFEPEPDNFRLLEENTAGYDNAHLVNAAVFTGDLSGLKLSVKDQKASACHHLTFDEDGEQVDVYALDDIVRAMGFVGLLKLDCEGAEYSILYESKCLRRIRRIVGEAHEGPGRPYCLPDLVLFLEAHGYDVEAGWMPDSIGKQGLFFATRRA